MNRRWSTKAGIPVALALCTFGGQAWAQDGGASPAGGAGDPSVQVVTVPTAPSAPPTIFTPGFPAPGTNIDGYLPSSSQSKADINQGDTFDLNQGSGSQAIRGGEGGQYVSEGSFVPEGHTVRRGDTLWDISARYYKTPYQWPKIWAFNPQIQNPHWIYPGDRVRLRVSNIMGGGLSISSPRSVPPQTVFLRTVGWIDDPEDDTWGELVGASDDQMLLGFGEEVYIQMDDDREVTVGDELTVFRPFNTLGEAEDSDDELVSIRGTVRVNRVNRKTHMIRATVVESIDVIERGALVGPLQRRFEVVPPVRNEQDIEANIIGAVYPYVFFGKDQTLFINKGSEDGVKPGNRFSVVRRGDLWERGLKTTDDMARLRARVEDDRPARVDKTPLDGDEDSYPDETYAEIRVISVREHSALCIVTASKIEVERDAYLLARKGF